MMKKSSQTTIASFIMILAILFGVYLFMQDNNFIWYWIFGLGFGFVLQRFRICFLSTVSDPLITNSTEQFRAILIGILVSSLGITVVKYLSSGMLDMLGVATISVPLMLGSFIFGVGMVLSGCCSSGMFIRLAEGYSIHIFTIISVIAGYLISTNHYSSLWASFVVNAPAIFLPSEIGWGTGIAAHVIIILLIYLVALKLEQNTSSSNNTKYLKGAILLSILNIVYCILLESGWSVTGAFFWFGECFHNLITSNPIQIDENTLIIAAGSNIQNLGLFVGALISVFTCAKFKFQKIRSFKQVCITIVGGLLMGYGAGIAGGCTISAFFVAASSISLSAWVFLIFLFIGAFVGIKLLYKLL